MNCLFSKGWLRFEGSYTERHLGPVDIVTSYYNAVGAFY